MSDNLTIGGSTINLGKRYSGAPSTTYPMLRDLANESLGSRVIVEIDTSNDRYVGYIDRLVPNGNRPPSLIVANDVPSAFSKPEAPRTRKVKHEVAFDRILAFRVLEIGPS